MLTTEVNQYAKEYADVFIFCSGLTVLDKEPDSPFDADKRHQEVTKPQAAPTPPVASLGRTKSQRRFKGWIMALMVACALSCCGVMGWCVWVVVR